MFLKRLVNKKWKKLIWTILGVIIAVVVVVIIFISPIAKYLIEKYDVKYTGREIKMNWLYLNPFTGYLHIDGLRIYEAKSDSIFFQCDGITTQLVMWKLIGKNYEISKLILDKPKATVILNLKHFNFDDLIEKFTPKEPVDTLKPPIHFNLLNLKIKDGTFYFIDKGVPVYYYVKEVNFESSGKHWDIDSMTGKMDLKSGIGSGEMKAAFAYHFNTNEYRFDASLKKFDLNLISQYMKDLTNYGSFTANIDADLKGSGHTNDKQDVDATGTIAINDFHFGEKPGDDFASFKKLELDLDRINPKGKMYFIDSIKLLEPFFVYEQYDYLDNIQRMFGKKGENVKEVDNSGQFNLIIEIAKYIKEMVRNFFRSYYKLNRLDIIDANIGYTDYSLREKFAVQLSPLNIYADSMDKYHNNVQLFINSRIQPFGSINVSLNMNPKSYEDFVLQYHLDKVPISIANPYLTTYTSYPFNRGSIELQGKWNVSNGNISSDNHLLIIDPRINRRVKTNDAKWIPMHFVMALLRENGNVIDYQIPITGQLKDPKFHLRDATFDILKNIFVKPVTFPYRFQVRSVEGDIEKTWMLSWESRSSRLRSGQINFLNDIAEFLEANPAVKLNIIPMQYEDQEIDAILFFEAKKKYVCLKDKLDPMHLTSNDSLAIEKMSVRDSFFVRKLDLVCTNKMLFTMQEKCQCYLGDKPVSEAYSKLINARILAVKEVFDKNNTWKNIHVFASKNIIPYNGFSFFSISYSGELPEKLKESYMKIDELDNKNPRKPYKNKRKRLVGLAKPANTTILNN